MIKLRQDIRPSDPAMAKLREFQSEIDVLAKFEEQSTKAKAIFPRKNTSRNTTFREVKRCLSQMCNSTRRCVYCEDSLGDEVEHIYPKDLYPGRCFDWENYIYACGPCNGPKNNKFAIFSNPNDTFMEVNPPRGTPATKPPEGEAVFINPRIEDPLEFAILDIKDTFKFYPLPDLDDKNSKRTEYTYFEVLRLNHEEREPLRQARENAYEMYKARLFQYVIKKGTGSPDLLLRLKEGILKENHPTVWKEMQRYYKLNLLEDVDSELKELFDKAPEALTW